MAPSSHVPVQIPCANALEGQLPPASVTYLIDVQVIFTSSVLGWEQGYSQSKLKPSKPYLDANAASDAMNAFLFAAVLTATENKAEGKVQPPMAEIILSFEFCDLYPTKVLILDSSFQSINIISNGFFPLQSVATQ